MSSTDQSRRNLLIGLGVGGVGVAALAAPAVNLALSPVASKGAGNWWDRMFQSLRNGSVEDWAKVKGQVFSVDTEVGPVPVILSDVKLLLSKGTRPRECNRNRAFALTFSALPQGAPTGDRIYRFTHASYPPLEIFVAPAVKLPRAARFTAVFN